MTNKEIMQSDEIIKALKCCIDQKNKCDDCPLMVDGYFECKLKLMKNALDLINRIRAEAIKEFADIVKTLWANNGGYEFERKFYNLVKEITEAKDDR